MCVATRIRRRDRRGEPLNEDEWCAECRISHAAHVECQADIARLSVEANLIASIPPATDEEWKRHMDDVAPTVIEMAEFGVPDSLPCPLCNQAGSIEVHSPAHGHLTVDCPWCGGVGVVPDLPGWDKPDLSNKAASHRRAG